MPLKRLKYTFDYCKPNPIGFLIILLLIYSIGAINDYASWHTIKYKLIFYPIAFFITIFIYGYGMAITKDTIRKGEKLPIIKLKQCTIYGIKTFILMNLYSFIEGYILYLLSRIFYLPKFTLIYALSHIMNTLKSYYAYNPTSTIEFIICSIIPYSTVTDLARFRGWSTLRPFTTATWYESNCKGITLSNGARHARV